MVGPLLKKLLLFLVSLTVIISFSSCVKDRPFSIEQRVNAVVRIDAVVREFADGRSLLSQGTGAGVIISQDGVVVTNYHVVTGAVRISATLYDGREVQGKIIGLDSWTDLAVIKLQDVAALPYIEFGDSKDLVIGDTVYAIGSPRRMRYTVSKGVLASPHRFLATAMYFPDGSKTGTFTAWLQTDALIESGSSGGPLLNSDGYLVGIVARSYSGGSGFAIPSEQVKLIVSSLLSTGSVVRGWFGITWSPSQQYVDAIGADADIIGPVVTELDDESPFLGKLKPGDIVTSLNGVHIPGRYKVDLPEVRNFISRIPPGTEVKIEYFRKGVGFRDCSATTGTLSPAAGKNAECKEWGMTVRGITREMKRDLNLPDSKGVFITGVRRGGPASAAQIGGAYVIRSVNGVDIDTFETFMKAFADSLKKEKTFITTTAGKFTLMHSIEIVKGEEK